MGLGFYSTDGSSWKKVLVPLFHLILDNFHFIFSTSLHHRDTFFRQMVQYFDGTSIFEQNLYFWERMVIAKFGHDQFS
jgi:hypothetical protein